ncbi:MAG: serine hydrolase, partial [Lentisphaerae bacterium]|nr:serine hydrolase [Lentisphaerota bacterium]
MRFSASLTYGAPAVIAAVVAWQAGCRHEMLTARQTHPGFPGPAWPRLPPAEAGFDTKTLDVFVNYVAGSGFLARHGCAVRGWGAYTQAFDVASAVKPIYAHMVYTAIEEGRIADLDAPVARHEPRLAGLNAALNHKDRDITWRHLLTQTACYGVVEPPGAAFNYCDYQMALLIDTLVKRVYGACYPTSDDTVFRPRLWDVIGCQDRPTFTGVNARWGRLRISPRDFVRFGLLYRYGGRWGGRQLIPRELAVQAVTTPVTGLPRTSQAA